MNTITTTQKITLASIISIVVVLGLIRYEDNAAEINSIFGINRVVTNNDEPIDLRTGAQAPLTKEYSNFQKFGR